MFRCVLLLSPPADAALTLFNLVWQRSQITKCRPPKIRPATDSCPLLTDSSIMYQDFLFDDTLAIHQNGQAQDLVYIYSNFSLPEHSLPPLTLRTVHLVLCRTHRM